MLIRLATQQDFEGIWPIYHEVLASGESYSYSPETTKDEARNYWMAPATSSYVAEIDGQIAGSYALRANRTGLASHVANASFIVNKAFRGRGVGRALGEHALAEAKARGFEAMQFNFVVSTNSVAVALWQSLGFQIVGTVPKAFRHARLGKVDVYIMHRFL